MKLSRLLTAGAATATLLGGTLVVATAPSAAGAAARSTEAAAAAHWVAGQLVDGALPGFAGPDWGLTIDAVFALSATGADPTALAAATDAVAVHVRSYNSFDDFGTPGVRLAGPTAKLLVAALATRRDPTRFGGFNLRQETLDLVAGADQGDNAGRVRDVGTTPDSSNTFAQAFAVIGLARTGGVAAPVVDFLLKQQCSAGGFRLSPDQFGTPAPTCDQATEPVLDPDSTAMAVQALLTADTAGIAGAKAAADKGAAWLLSIQHPDGSFGGSGPTEAPNTNSTGLAAEALAATGHTTEADQAAAYLAAHQLTCANAGAAAAHVAAIAYNDDALTDATANGIPDFGLDQWRRATTQAILGLAAVPLGDLGTTDPGAPTAPTPCTTPTTTTTESPTSTTNPTSTTTSPAPAAQGSTAPPTLAATGTPVDGLLLIAVLLLGGGLVLGHLTRRRPRRSR